MEELARVYSEALFGAAKGADKLDAVREQLGQFTDAIDQNREMQILFFSPYFSSAEKQEALDRAVDGAEPELRNFLRLLIEKHRMPIIFRTRRRFEDLWAEENKRLEVTVTSAIELDEEVVEQIGREVEKQTGHKVDLESRVDDSIVGGLVLQVGNMVLDASVRNRLDELRKHVAAAA